MFSCKAQWLLIAVAIVLGTMQMLASCGQKGDLYLPDDDATEERR
ncbi:lipoprotein [Thioalkalivibrio sp. ALJ16]|nr:lipoprotein [Thioalkalivibrio sp. ALJ16]